MASAKREIMKFEKAIKSMGVSEIKECLVKIVNFLNRNDLECFFPNVSVAIESFLLGLVSENRNLKCKLFNAECEKLASEIIESLELHRDVFGWTYAYENGTMNEEYVYPFTFCKLSTKYLCLPNNINNQCVISSRKHSMHDQNFSILVLFYRHFKL